MVCRWEGGEVEERGGECSISGGRWGKTFVQISSSRFLKTLTKGAVTTEAGSLFQYFTTLNENADIDFFFFLNFRITGALSERSFCCTGRSKWWMLRPHWSPCRHNYHGTLFSLEHVRKLFASRTSPQIKMARWPKAD